MPVLIPPARYEKREANQPPFLLFGLYGSEDVEVADFGVGDAVVGAVAAPAGAAGVGVCRRHDAGDVHQDPGA